LFKRLVSVMLLALLLTGLLTLMFNTGTVKGTWTGTVYIRADGSIDPPDAPITTYDNITYTLTDNITSIAHGIVVERDNIIIDGGGYTVEGTRAYYSMGIALSNRINVTIKDINVKNFDYGLYLYFSSNNNVAGNKIEAHKYGGVGLYLLCSSNNSIIGNVIANSYDGMRLEGSSNNTIFGNHVTANYKNGIYLYPQLYPTTIISSDNIIYANNITNNKEGIRIERSINNVIYANNVTNNEAME
jgi:parallel beta-helix repeat protein